MDFRELRQSRRLSQRRVAEAIEVSTQTIRNWEKGRSEPSLKVDQIESLCQILQCSLSELAEAIRESKRNRSSQNLNQD
ncbi:helix-turn-helix transcriptional regulator [Leptolyngbya sp. AN03gr2]|uniref:helix-turn-helix transcriptional regulator n=1 Tax=unclassified Leptolyngbya TaxID=2650499 RepID=UPI003D31F783